MNNLTKLTLHVSHIPQHITFRTKMRTFLFSMVYCVIWDMCIVGFMEIVCSSLVQDQLHVITLQTYTWSVMAMGGCPTNLDRIRQFWFFSRGLGDGAVRQALRQRHLCGTERAAHSTEQQNMLRGNFFQFLPDSNQIWCAYWAIE